MNGAVHVVNVGVGAVPVGDLEGGAVTAALARAGVPVATRAFVDEDDTALEHALADPGGVTVLIAGPGGSAGDIVRRVLARVAGVRLTLNQRMLAALEDSYRRRDRSMPRRAERLALLPLGATVVPLGHGEPAWILDVTRGAFIVLPRGHSADTDRFVADHVVPAARGRAGGRGAVVVRTLKVVGASVGDVEERLIDVLSREGDVSVLVVPTEGEVWVRLRARGASESDATDAVATTEADVRAALGDDCFGADADTLEQVVARQILERGLTLAVAESCTGGLLGHRLTNLAGSSAYFERGVIVYSNRAKVELLGVPAAVLDRHGAVSSATAEAMARGISERAGARCALSITGIAGPEGGSPAKPVGTVFIGLSVDGRVSARRFLFTGNRGAIKWQSTQMALDMLRRSIGALPGGE